MSFDWCTHRESSNVIQGQSIFFTSSRCLRCLCSHSFPLFPLQTTLGLFSVNIKECVFVQTDYTAHPPSCLLLLIWNNNFCDSCMRLHASVVPSFQVVMILFLIWHLLMDIRVISSFNLLQLNLLWTCTYKFFRYLFSLFLVKYLRVENRLGQSYI